MGVKWWSIDLKSHTSDAALDIWLILENRLKHGYMGKLVYLSLVLQKSALSGTSRFNLLCSTLYVWTKVCRINKNTVGLSVLIYHAEITVLLGHAKLFVPWLISCKKSFGEVFLRNLLFSQPTGAVLTIFAILNSIYGL